ncbi:jg5826 [Pararge aegeria aegeria]|uniref:Jg5826 protein n=1 Tax=Pararge aegeria aegeria TaxID=348720 RepID=A0A8S4REC8_9NEOP|nr:jg5826 [Pararge aegeria aegeria]
MTENDYADKFMPFATSQWRGPKGITKKGRPKERWADEIESGAGENWLERAQNKPEWQKRVFLLHNSMC